MRASNGRSVARWNRLRADGRKSPAAAHRHLRRCACTDINTHAGRFRTLVHGGEIDPLFLPRETPLESFLIPPCFSSDSRYVSGAFLWCARDTTRSNRVTEFPRAHDL